MEGWLRVMTFSFFFVDFGFEDSLVEGWLRVCTFFLFFLWTLDLEFHEWRDG